MKTILGTALTTLLVLVGAGFVRADNQADAQAIIARAMKAAGGEENLAKYKAMKWNEKGMFYGFGDGVAYTGHYAVQLPGQYRMEIEGIFTMVLDGDKGWVSMGGTTEPMNKDQMAEWKESMYAGGVANLVALKDKAYTLTPLGESKVEGKTVVGVKVAQKGHPDISLFFDKDSGLLVKSQYLSKMEGKEANQETFYGDYKEFKGIKVPMKMLIKRDGKKFVEGENSDMEVLEQLDNKVFAKP